jgi:hypothetical protein
MQALLLGGILALSAGAAAGRTKPPRFFKDDFPNPTTIDNPYFPLVPGTKFLYHGMKADASTKDVMKVTRDTKEILGVQCVVVRDTAWEDGVLVEDTQDWYAQDRCGNVWYMGEDTKEYDENGNVVSTEGSWEAGIDGAKPGFLMESHPRVGDTYYQEYSKDVAEDQAKVISRSAHLTVPYGSFKHCVETKEWSRLTPDEITHKYYARGIGYIHGRNVAGEEEHESLVRVVTDDSE